MLQNVAAKIGVGQLTALEPDCQLDFVAFLQESAHHLGAVVDVMFIDLGAEPDFLEDYLLLALASISFLLGLVVLELTIVHQLADRRILIGCDLYEVEATLLCQGYSVACEHEGVFTAFTDQAYFPRPDSTIYTEISCNVFSPLLHENKCRPVHFRCLTIQLTLSYPGVSVNRT